MEERIVVYMGGLTALSLMELKEGFVFLAIVIGLLVHLIKKILIIRPQLA
jgi:hypothetical protein